MEETQGIEEITSEKSRGRMAHATALNRRNQSDTFACLTRPRGLEAARTTRKRGRRTRVEDAYTLGVISRRVLT